NANVPPKPIEYAKEFNAGYELFEFDVDSHPSEKINEARHSITQTVLDRLQQTGLPNPVLVAIRPLKNGVYPTQEAFLVALKSVLTDSQFKTHSSAIKLAAMLILPTSFANWVDAAKLRAVQRFELLPSDMLLVTPSDTSDTQKWEAWYPSTRVRRELLQLDNVKGGAKSGSQAVYSSWYSWRESVLEWPDPSGRITEQPVPLELPNASRRWVIEQRLHPYLMYMVDRLVERLERKMPGTTAVFGPNAVTPATLSELMSVTNSDVDAYGWGLLNRLGLSASFTLRDGHGDPISTADFVDDLRELSDGAAKANVDGKKIDASGALTAGAITLLEPGWYLTGTPIVSISSAPTGGTNATAHVDPTKIDRTTGRFQTDAIVIDNPGAGYDKQSPPTVTVERSGDAAKFIPHLYFECLYQPAKSIRSVRDESTRPGGEVAPDELLAVMQISLRPIVSKHFKYARIVFDHGPAEGPWNVKVSNRNTSDDTYIIIKGYSSDEQIKVNKYVTGPNAAETIVSVPRPTGSQLSVLVRYATTSTVPTIVLSEKPDGTGQQFPPKPTVPFEAYDNDSQLFNSDVKIVADALIPDNRWKYLVRLIQALNLRELPLDKLTLQLPDSTALAAEGA
ncbi:MAG: hypothetical protein WCK15_24775, partial [Pirellula sp.]